MGRTPGLRWQMYVGREGGGRGSEGRCVCVNVYACVGDRVRQLRFRCGSRSCLSSLHLLTNHTTKTYERTGVSGYAHLEWHSALQPFHQESPGKFGLVWCNAIERKKKRITYAIFNLTHDSHPPTYHNKQTGVATRLHPQGQEARATVQVVLLVGEAGSQGLFHLYLK